MGYDVAFRLEKIESSKKWVISLLSFEVSFFSVQAFKDITQIFFQIFLTH